MPRPKIDQKYQAAVRAALAQERKRIASLSPQHFAKVYLEAEFSKPPCRMHEELFAALLELHQHEGARLAVAAPRAHAKSTIATMAFPLWALLCKREAFVVLASGTEGQASRLLEHVRKQMEDNPLLLEDFPELAKAKRSAPWRKGELLLPSGEKIMAFSSNQNLRGIRHRQHRPTLIIADDLEDRNAVVSEELRAKLKTWFTATLLKAGTSKTRVVVVGNVLHDDSLLANLLDRKMSPLWTALRYQAVEQFSPRQDLWDYWGRIVGSDETFEGETGRDAAKRFMEANRADMFADTKVLWPEGYGYQELMEARFNDGEATFQAEFQNDPSDPDTCVFASSKLRFWDDTPMTAAEFLRRLGFRYGSDHPGEFFGACDPSLGSRPGKGDFTAIVILFKPFGSKVCYVMAADIERRGPEETIERIVQLAKIFPLRHFAVESNNFQRMLYTQLKCRLEAETHCYRVEAITNTKHKQQRIMAIEPEVVHGRLIFSRKHQRLLEQLRAYPAGKHDDGPDALEMALSSSKRDYRVYRINL